MKVTHGMSDADLDGPRVESVLALMALALLLVAGFLMLSPATSNAITAEVTAFLASSEAQPATNSSLGGLSLSSPLIVNGAANVSYPADYKALATFTLGLINQDRAN